MKNSLWLYIMNLLPKHDPPLTAEQRQYRWQNARVVLLDYLFTLVLLAILFGLPTLLVAVPLLSFGTLFFMLRWLIVPQHILDDKRLRWEQKYGKPIPNELTRVRNNGLVILPLFAFFGLISHVYVSILGVPAAVEVMVAGLLFSCCFSVPYFGKALRMAVEMAVWVVGSVASASLMLVPLVLLLLLSIELWHPVLGLMAIFGLTAWWFHFLLYSVFEDKLEYVIGFSLFFMVTLIWGVAALIVNHPAVYGVVLGGTVIIGTCMMAGILFMEYVLPPLFMRLKQWVTAQMRRWFPARAVQS